MNKELKMKSRKGELTLTESDTIMFNGACYQLITQSYYEGFGKLCYELSKTTCNKLIKNGQLTLINQDIVKGLDYYKLA